jgi:hypothetical protein
MPSWDDGESSEDSLLSEFADGHDLIPRLPVSAVLGLGFQLSDLRFCSEELRFVDGLQRFASYAFVWIPTTILEPSFTGYDDSDFRCKHDMPMYRYVCYEGENTGRKFLEYGCKVG